MVLAEFDIFISYRRDGGEQTARLIFEHLTQCRYSVFLDREELRSSEFNKQLYKRIEECKDFILVLSPNALDRCKNEGDWVRCEIAHALNCGKNIIPVIIGRFNFPEVLPRDIEELIKQNGVPFSLEFYDAFEVKLKSFLISQPNRFGSKSRLSRNKFNKIVLLIMLFQFFIMAIWIGIRLSGDSNDDNTISIQAAELTDFGMILPLEPLKLVCESNPDGSLEVTTNIGSLEISHESLIELIEQDNIGETINISIIELKESQIYDYYATLNNDIAVVEINICTDEGIVLDLKDDVTFVMNPKGEYSYKDLHVWEIKRKANSEYNEIDLVQLDHSDGSFTFNISSDIAYNYNELTGLYLVNKPLAYRSLDWEPEDFYADESIPYVPDFIMNNVKQIVKLTTIYSSSDNVLEELAIVTLPNQPDDTTNSALILNLSNSSQSELALDEYDCIEYEIICEKDSYSSPLSYTYQKLEGSNDPRDSRNLYEIPTNNSSYSYLLRLHNDNVFNGYPNNTLRLEDEITRGEMAKLLSNIFELQIDYTIGVDDISEENQNTWYLDPIRSTHHFFPTELNADNDIFERNANMTYEYMIVTFVKATGDLVPSYTNTKSSSDGITDGWYNYIYYAKDKGWLDGYDTNEYEYSDYVTREDVFILIDQYLRSK